MERVVDVAQYMIDAYKKVSGDELDELKLHKLLYFAQREALAIAGTPLFKEPFFGWKFGPVCRKVRSNYSPDSHSMASDDIRPLSAQSKYLIDNIIAQYGEYASWKLSELSHKEISWRNARQGLSPDQNGNRQLSLDDIRKDAEKIRPYDSFYDMYYDEFEDAEGLP